MLPIIGRSERSQTTARDAEDHLQASRTAHTILSRPPRRLGLARHSWRRWCIKCTEATRRPDAVAATLKTRRRPWATSGRRRSAASCRPAAALDLRTPPYHPPANDPYPTDLELSRPGPRRRHVHQKPRRRRIGERPWTLIQEQLMTMKKKSPRSSGGSTAVGKYSSRARSTTGRPRSVRKSTSASGRPGGIIYYSGRLDAARECLASSHEAS